MSKKLTEAGPPVRLQVVTMATLAAEAQTIIVSAMTQDTNLLATTIVSATRVHHCETRRIVLIL